MALECAANDDPGVEIVKVFGPPIGRFWEWRTCRAKDKQYQKETHASASSFAEEKDEK